MKTRLLWLAISFTLSTTSATGAAGSLGKADAPDGPDATAAVFTPPAELISLGLSARFINELDWIRFDQADVVLPLKGQMTTQEREHFLNSKIGQNLRQEIYFVGLSKEPSTQPYFKIFISMNDRSMTLSLGGVPAFAAEQVLASLEHLALHDPRDPLLQLRPSVAPPELTLLRETVPTAALPDLYQTRSTRLICDSTFSERTQQIFEEDELAKKGWLVVVTFRPHGAKFESLVAGEEMARQIIRSLNTGTHGVAPFLQNQR